MVAILYSLGDPNPVIEAMLTVAPEADGATSGEVKINAAHYLPTELGHFRYDGSLTTPPCTEGRWLVMGAAGTVSQEQVDRLQAVGGGPNNRPLQPIGTRSLVAVG